jgi:hypothetical protein
MKKDRDITQQLKQCGAVLLRQRTHEVWRLPNGRRFVRSVSPSDRYAFRNQERELSKLLEQSR